VSKEAVQAACRQFEAASEHLDKEEAMEAAIDAAVQVELRKRGISWADAFGPSYSNPEKGTP
jgi:hypothetical protein